MLSKEEKRLLEVVLNVAGDNEDMIETGIKKALRDYGPSYGEAGAATRKHLWVILPRAAREKIRRLRQKMPRLVGV